MIQPGDDLAYGFQSEEDLIEEDRSIAHPTPWPESMCYLVEPEAQRNDPDAPGRILNHALALYDRMLHSRAVRYEGMTRVELFAVALDTAITWEVG